MSMSETDDYTNQCVKTEHEKLVEIGEYIDSGKEGDIYNVKSKQSVVKIYKPDRRSKEIKQKLQVMVSNPPEDPTLKKRGFRSIIWPTHILYESNTNQMIGYQMPRINLKNYKNILDYSEEDLDWRGSTECERYRTAINMANGVAIIHSQGHAIGDMNHQNILVKDGLVCFLDCDSYTIGGKINEYTGSTYTDRYCPPEGRGKNVKQGQKADRFGLAVFQILMNGTHPYTNKGIAVNEYNSIKEKINHTRFSFENPAVGQSEPPQWAPTYKLIQPNVRSLFWKCFVDGKKRAKRRPTAEKWADELTDAKDYCVMNDDG